MTVVIDASVALKWVLAEVGSDDADALLEGDDLVALPAAIQLAGEPNHPVYDCLYLALALREGTHVVTADRRFVEAAAARPTLSTRVRILRAGLTGR